MQIHKILLVDDDDDLRHIGRISLTLVGGFEVIEATSGIEALELARSEQPQLVLLDVMMPGMDGVTTLLKLRDDGATADIPIIFMTAKAQKREVEHYQELGAAGVIVKPFDPMRLPAQIHEISEAA
jgi:two-component system OmpR family response regulator